MRIKKEKRSKKERKRGLWKLTPRMEIRRERGFPPRLEKSLAQNARLFHSSHRPDGGVKVITFFRQRCTLRSLIFCPKDGEHLIRYRSFHNRNIRHTIHLQVGFQVTNVSGERLERHNFTPVSHEN